MFTTPVNIAAPAAAPPRRLWNRGSETRAPYQPSNRSLTARVLRKYTALDNWATAPRHATAAATGVEQREEAMADLLNNPRIVSGRLTGPLSDVAQDFGLLPASHLDGNRYIPRYVAQVYLQRHDAITDADADTAAEEALRHAVATNGAGALGICVFGRPALGKTRLAWEAMQGVLP